MGKITTLFVETIASSLFLIPPIFSLHRSRNWEPRKTISYILFSLYLAAVYDAAGLPNILYISFDPRCNLTPFLYMFSDYQSSVLNVLLFFPLGLSLPLLWKSFRNARYTLLLGFSASLLIEFLQIFTHRATDINDLLTNTAGTILGYWSAKCILGLFPTAAQDNPQKELPVIAAAVFVVMFFLQVFVSDFIWKYLL